MKIAVVIPCYNVAEHIGRAVGSVLAQTHRDLDIVAVDDGSTDGTAEELDRYVQQGLLRCIRQDRKGASAARNVGMLGTEGEYIQFLDADDELAPDKIGRQVELIRAAKDPALIIGDYIDRMEDGTTTEKRCGTDDPWMALIKGRLGTTSADLWQRASVLSVGAWDPTLASSQDHELAFRVMRAQGKVVFDGRADTTILKRNKGSISKGDPIGNWERYIALRVSIREHMRTTDATAYAEHIATVDQLIFGAVRIVSKSDPAGGYALFEKHLPTGFVPRAEGATSAAYLRLYKWMGFSTAERAIGALDNLQRMFGKG